MKEIILNTQHDTAELTERLLKEVTRDPSHLSCILCTVNKSVRLIIIVFQDTSQTCLTGVCKDCIDKNEGQDMMPIIEEAAKAKIAEGLGIKITHREWIQ